MLTVKGRFARFGELLKASVNSGEGVDMSGKSGPGGRVSGKSTNAVAVTVDQNLIEAIAALSPLLPEIKNYTITATVGSNVSVTLTHNIGIAEYLIQLVNSNGQNIVMPVTRDANTVVFYFGEVTVEEDYSVIIVH